MFKIVNSYTLIDLINEEKIVLTAYKDKEKVDISLFLDDISLWMDKSREIITEKYLPFCVLSVGIEPHYVSSFMYGLFVGKAIEKHGLSIKSTVSKITKKEISDIVKGNSNFHNGILGDSLREDFKENQDGDEKEGKRK